MKPENALEFVMPSVVVFLLLVVLFIGVKLHLAITFSHIFEALSAIDEKPGSELDVVGALTI